MIASPEYGEADRITELAPAKVNLTLRVLGRRPDGYHALESLVTFADIGDVLEFSPGTESTVTSHGQFASSIIGENLVERALERLAQVEPALRLGSITIEKNLPVAAGLGGGSADAAALLRAVMRANPAQAQSLDWHGLAASFGADVPVCLANTPSLMWGIGNRIRPVHGLPRLPAVLANPGPIAPPDKTREVFSRLSAPPLTVEQSSPAPLPTFTSAEDFMAYLGAHGNDLADPAHALMPACLAVEAALAACPGCRLVRTSGAGPTSYGLFDTQAAAHSAADALSRAHLDWWIRAVMLG